MYADGFPFVARNWADDKATLTRCIRVFTRENWPIHFHLYPEGTALYSKSLARNTAFMEKEGLKPYVLLMLCCCQR